MTAFTARHASNQTLADLDVDVVGVSEDVDGGVRQLTFEHARSFSEQDRQLGMDTFAVTNVVIELEQLDAGMLPEQLAVSAVTMAELAAGPHATEDPDERARRQDRLARAEATFEPLPFDAAAARAYGRIYAAVLKPGRKARGQRATDLLIAAVALSTELPLFTRHEDDFLSLEHLVDVVAVSRPT
jgi:predicted nucleic acid-binding protein